MRVRPRKLLVSASSLWSVYMLQGPTPTATPQVPFWRVTQDQVPYLIVLAFALLAFIFGILLRPVLEDAGDALRRRIKGVGRAGKFRQRYLGYIIAQNRHLPMLPANVVTARWQFRRKAIELEELYTPLSLGGSDDEGYATEVLSGGPARRTMRNRARGSSEPNLLQRLWWRIRPPVEPLAGDLGPTVERSPRLVVRGDPGSGKSTILRYLALTCARSLRGLKSDGDDRKLARRRLGWRRRPLPILVNLNLLSDVCTWPEKRRLLDEIVDTLPGELRDRYPADFFEGELKRGNCLVLFDGFDELGSRAARGRMALLINDLAGTFHGRNARHDNLYVVSTRIVGYEGQLNAFDFAVRTVDELDDEAIRTLVYRRYRAIAVGEGLGRSQQEQKDLLDRYQSRAGELLADLRRNEGLRKLTTNPLLLSLIVLVHQVQVKLPEQRHMLYRDCVEILTEKWRAGQRDSQGLPTAPRPDDLSLEQKIELLREIALTMQQRRDRSESQAVISREEALGIMAHKLPNYLAAFLPEAPDARQQKCSQRAVELLDAIHAESGILVEKGLDSAGEPVVGFSHLTFQEYLAADAIRERPSERAGLLQNLFNPDWREVLLLYVGMTDASEVIRACLNDANHPVFARYLLAGRCLAEKVTLEDVQLRQQVTDGLGAYFTPSGSTGAEFIPDLVRRVGGERNFDWLLSGFVERLPENARQVLAAPIDARAQPALFTAVQSSLLQVMQGATDSVSRYTAGCVLSALGDPRDLDEMVPVAAGSFRMGSDEYDWERPPHDVTLSAYRIGKYPVTNGQYARFVEATGHAPPRHWNGPTPPDRLRSHPVVYVSWRDARAYCAWLSGVRGEEVRLPTEAEWEKAARGTDGRAWPWGDTPPTPDHCNFNMDVGDTTAVGSYPLGASPCGALDMAGNVWEWTSSLYKRYPYQAGDGREDPEAEGARTLRGGVFSSTSTSACAAPAGTATIPTTGTTSSVSG